MLAILRDTLQGRYLRWATPTLSISTCAIATLVGIIQRTVLLAVLEDTH
ncbi:hypothetical protein [Nostoc sp.]